MQTMKIHFNEVLGYAGFVLFVMAVVTLITFNSGHSYDIQEVSVTEAKELYDSGALVIDVRSNSSYVDQHIMGAISIPLAVLRKGIPDSIADARAQRIVVYCGDGVTIGPEGTHLLNQAGFTNAVNVKEGLPGWEKAGYPLQK